MAFIYALNSLFLLGLKRIAVAAVLAAIVVGLIWNGLKRFPHVSRFLLRVAGILFLVSALAYVGAVFYGLYDYLEQIGINTSARLISTGCTGHIISSRHLSWGMAWDG